MWSWLAGVKGGAAQTGERVEHGWLAGSVTGGLEDLRGADAQEGEKDFVVGRHGRAGVSIVEREVRCSTIIGFGGELGGS